MGGYDGLRAQVDRDELTRHLDEFSRWTKHAGTAEELSSLSYVEAKMRSYGYRTDLVTHPAYISLPGPASVEALGRPLRAIAHSFSRSSPDEGVTGELVDVRGGRAADYEGLDASGRIVLVDGVASPSASVEAGGRGALAQVHVSPH